MSESSESLCKLISNILGINWAINQRYMLYLVQLSGAGLCAPNTRVFNTHPCVSCNCKRVLLNIFFLAPPPGGAALAYAVVLQACCTTEL